MTYRTWRLGELRSPVIDEFVGEWEFLSNFFPAPTPYGGRVFPTSEHAFAAAKTTDVDAIVRIAGVRDPAEAKAIGRAAPLRPDWDRDKFAVMEAVVTAKFEHNPGLGGKLLATRGSLIVEGNIWHDQTWGSCSCERHRTHPGDNALGIILMAVRMRLSANG
ncbi:NADAR family protein [Rhodococcus sp. Q]|uniref:NADAR family protein n=1 Tax=Rhodococcus sp. Q TaxID=2502252 RepID=UPI0010FA065F|nr:NADAR family protein [Rhodococcus sp. Q]